MVNSSKAVILLVISFLAVLLIYSSVAFAVVKTTGTRDNPECEINEITKHKTCCWNEPGLGPFGNSKSFVMCQECHPAVDDEYHCEKPYCPNGCPKSRPLLGTKAPTSGGTLEQPPTSKKHGGTVLPKGGNVLEQPDQGTTQTDDNKHSVKRSEGGGVLEQPQTGELTAKKGGNNDNSPTPPACPDKGPIPPNCTLKPKF